jgi:hypothetical protein
LLEISGKNEIRGWDHGGDYWFDLGSREKLDDAEKNLIRDPDHPGLFVLA